MTGKWVEWELRAGVFGRFEGREGGGQGRGLGFWAIFRIFCEFPESRFSGKRYNKRHRFSLRRGVFWGGRYKKRHRRSFLVRRLGTAGHDREMGGVGAACGRFGAV